MWEGISEFMNGILIVLFFCVGWYALGYLIGRVEGSHEKGKKFAYFMIGLFGLLTTFILIAALFGTITGWYTWPPGYVSDGSEFPCLLGAFGLVLIRQAYR